MYIEEYEENEEQKFFTELFISILHIYCNL
jgi:hypothetical protein